MIRWRERLGLKLLTVLFIVGFLPFGLILYYSERYGEQRLSAEAMQSQRAQMQTLAENINDELRRLERQLAFLSGVAVMEDLLVGDLDRRVTALLQRYKSAFGQEITLLAVDPRDTIIAGTAPQRLDRPYGHRDALRRSVELGHPVMIDDGRFLLGTTVHAGFERGEVIGYLLAEYDMANLARFTFESESVRAALLNAETNRSIGRLPQIPARLSGAEGMRSDRRQIVLYEALPELPGGWYLLYTLDRANAFAFLEDLNRYLVWLLGLGLVVIALVSYWISQRIVAPLRLLERSATEMAAGGTYDRDVPVRSHDEVGKLAQSFNLLLADIRRALEAEAQQSRFRLKRLTQLIDLFNALLHTESESRCLQTALTQLRAVVPEHDVQFSAELPRPGQLPLFVYDFELESRQYYGALALPEAVIDEHEQAFYRAVASMIASRIEQIRAYDRLHRHSEAKSAFISHISHELRTPLHAIMTQTQYLIGYGGLTQNQMAKVGQIEVSAEHLLGMINDILDLARLESGKYDAKLETIGVGTLWELVEEALQLLSPLAEQKSIALTRARLVREGKIVADRRLLRQVLINLLSNAIKFTDTGGVSCRLEQEEGRIVLSIRDSGRGIAAADLKHVFEPFYQSGRYGQKGTGLGLALSRNFSRLFDAELTLESAGEGLGSEARLRFTPV